MKHAALSKAPTDDLATLSEAPHRTGKVTLVVRALEPVLEFYRTVIGLDVIEREPHRALLGAGASALLELRLDAGARPRQVRDAGLFHTAFLLPARADLGAWLASASGGGARLTGASDHLVSEAVYLDDPEGNGIEIYVDRP